MNDNLITKVIIIGGGPAGIATSLTLTARGVTHYLVDALHMPTRKAGEAIPPNAKPLFQKLGIAKLLEHSQHQRNYGAKSYWGGTKPLQEEFLSNINGHGYLLDRFYFEKQLRQLAENTATNCFWGYKLLKVREEKGKVIATIANKTESLDIQAAFIVDATGRKASVCRHLGIASEVLDQQFCLSFRVKITTKIPKQIFVETTENGWWYAAPCEGDKELTLMFFTLKELLPKKQAYTTFLQTEWQKTKQLPDDLKQKTIQPLDIQILPAGTAALPKPYGQNWMAVGDAAYAFDPISSYGITSGIAAGYYGGNALADVIAGKENSLEVYHYILETAFQKYLLALDYQYAAETKWPTALYWKKRLSYHNIKDNASLYKPV